MKVCTMVKQLICLLCISVAVCAQAQNTETNRSVINASLPLPAPVADVALDVNDSIFWIKSGDIVPVAQLFSGRSQGSGLWRSLIRTETSTAKANAGIWSAISSKNQQLNLELENRGDTGRSYAMLGGSSGFDGIRIDNSDWSLVSTGPSDGFLDLRYRHASTDGFIDLQVLRRNSTGTPIANLGNSIRFQLESSTAEDRDAARVGVVWTSPIETTRSSAMVIQTVNNANTLAEVVRFAGGGRNIKLSGVSLFDGTTTSSEGVLISNYYTTSGNRQIMFMDSTQLDSTVSPGLRFLFLGDSVVNIDAITPVETIPKSIVFQANGGAGVQIGVPFGGDKGTGSLNAVVIYENGVPISLMMAQMEKRIKQLEQSGRHQ